MDIKELIEEGLGFESGSTNQKYKTDLTGKVREIKKDTLSDEVVSSFLNGEYKTYITIDEIILYRTYGRGYSKNKGAVWNGGYASTEFAESRIDVKIRLALKPEWLNTRLVEEKILVPVGTKINVGLVAPVTLNTGTILTGGAEQVLLPRNWPKEWIIGYREVTSKPLMDYPEFYSEPPIDNRENAK